MAANTLALGYNSTVVLDTGSNDGTFGATTSLGGYGNLTLNAARANVDASRVETGAFAGREYGLKQITLAGDLFDDQAGDSGQDQLIADYEAGTKRWLRCRLRIGTGYIEWLARFILENVNWVSPTGDLVKFSISAMSDGSYTKQDQT